MASQNPILFTKMDVNLNSLKDVMITLGNEGILSKKIQYMEHLVSNYVSIVPETDIDTSILSILLPQVKMVFEKNFERIIELMLENNDDEVCLQTLDILQEYLQVAISLLEILRNLLDIISGKNRIDFLSVKNLPLCITQVLYMTVLHCKDSNNIYKTYFHPLNEILTVFEKAREVNSKLLDILENCLVYNTSSEIEISLLNHVLDSVSELGMVLSEVNVKSMAENWKSYLNLTQKYANELHNCINIERPLLYFTSELVKNLNNILEMNICDIKTITNPLKVSNFFLRAVLKLYDSFSKRIASHMDILWNFFIDFYSLYFSAIKNKQFSGNEVNMLNSLIRNGLDHFLSKLIQIREFHDMRLLESIILNADCSLGFLLVENIVLQKLVSGENQHIAEINILQYVNITLTALSKSYILLMKEDKLYAELLLSIVNLISLSNDEQFFQIQIILYRNLQTQHLWNALFAYDAWYITARNCGPKYIYDLLCWLVEKQDTILKVHYTARSEFIVLTNFLSELYQILSNNYKLQFLKKYPLHAHLYLWKHITLKNFPSSCLMQVENLLIELCEKMEKFENGACTYDEYLSMIDIMNIFATVPFDEVYFDLKKLFLQFKKIWDFDVTDKSLLNSHIFKLFLESLVKLTQNLMWRLHNTELAQILNQLKQACEYDKSFKPLLLLLLNSLLNRSVDFSQDQLIIFKITSELLTTLITDDCILIEIEALQLFQKLKDNTAWNEVTNNIITKNAHLKRLTSSFMDKNVLSNINTFRTYIALEQTESRHECLVHMPLEPTVKRKKIDLDMVNTVPKVQEIKTTVENVEATRLIQRIRKDIQYLGNLVGKCDLTEQNTKDIDFILKELQCYQQ